MLPRERSLPSQLWRSYMFLQIVVSNVVMFVLSLPSFDIVNFLLPVWWRLPVTEWSHEQKVHSLCVRHQDIQLNHLLYLLSVLRRIPDLDVIAVWKLFTSSLPQFSKLMDGLLSMTKRVSHETEYENINFEALKSCEFIALSSFALDAAAKYHLFWPVSGI